jgi:hypothetical protein
VNHGHDCLLVAPAFRLRANLVALHPLPLGLPLPFC